MRRVTAGFIGLAAGIAIGAGTSSRWGGDIGAFLSSIPQPVATVIAAVVAAGVVAWQAQRALTHIIAGQNHRAKIERDARRDLDQIQRRQAFDERARDRFEVLVRSLDAHHAWIQSEEGHMLFGNDRVEGVSPAVNEALAIASMYFSDRVIPLLEFDLAADQYLQWVRSRGMLRINAKIEDVPSPNSGPEFLDELGKNYGPYSARRITLMGDLRRMAQAQLAAGARPT